jgi:DNA repair and recombination protein RAD52
VRRSRVSRSARADRATDMDEVDFAVSGDGHPDEVALENSIVSATSNGRPQAQTPGAASRMQPPGRPLARATSAGNLRGQPQTPNGQGLRSNGPQAVASHHAPPPRAQQAQNVGGLSSNSSATGGSSGLSTGSSTSSTTASANVPGAAQDGAEPNADGPGFFSARAINQLPVESLSSGAVVPLGGQVFNPRLESPSIRKTPGIDHTTSKPLARNGQHVMPTASQAAAVVAGPGGPSAAGINDANASPQGASHVGLRPAPLGVGGPPNRGNVVNPQLDQARRIGAPGSAGSPLANRGQYRPPTMKRPLPAEAPQRGPAGGGGGPGTRPPLAEVSTNGAGSASSVSSGADVKRQKMS